MTIPPTNTACEVNLSVGPSLTVATLSVPLLQELSNSTNETALRSLEKQDDRLTFSPWNTPLTVASSSNGDELDLSLLNELPARDCKTGASPPSFDKLSLSSLKRLSDRACNTILKFLEKQSHLPKENKQFAYDFIQAHRAITLTDGEYRAIKDQFPKNTESRSYNTREDCATTRYQVWISQIHSKWASINKIEVPKEFYSKELEHPLKESIKLRIYHLLTPQT